MSKEHAEGFHAAKSGAGILTNPYHDEAYWRSPKAESNPQARKWVDGWCAYFSARPPS